MPVVPTMAKHTPPFKVGDRVRLNDYGMDMIGGLRNRAMIDQAKDMRITEVWDLNEGSDWEPIWHIEVDQPLIGMYLLTAECVSAL